jgi:site-specific recombinase XerD
MRRRSVKGRRSASRGIGLPERPASHRSDDLRAWIKRFLVLYLPQHRGAAGNTVTSYGQALKSFLAFVARRNKRGEPTFRSVTAENVLAFLAYLEKKRENSAATRNARLAAIFSFLRFAFLMGHLGEKTFERLRHIAFKRETPRIPCYLEATELETIFRAVDYRTRDGFRDLVILKFLYNTGARASEVGSVGISDVDFSNLRVTITGKGRKTRLCSLWKTTVALIRIYLASERRTPQKGFEDFLFVGRHRRPLSRFGIYDIIRRHAREAAKYCPSLTRKAVTPHTIRHTTGVHLLESGVDLGTIREWLGHAHMATTEIYARPSLATKRQALAKLQDLDRRLFDEIIAARGEPEVDPSIRRWLRSLSD